MSTLIEPRVLKGFRDLLPDAEIERTTLEESLVGVFRSFGFVPIDTPVLEYAEILLGKSGGDTEKQIFRFDDQGGRDVAMRFDLTVPLARFMAEHSEELYSPFKRYQMDKVWRGEKPQQGRYREFMQCDFDIVGSDAAAADFEIAAVIVAAMKSLGIEDFTVRVNHRGIFNLFLDRLGAGKDSTELLRVIDRKDKVSAEETRSALAAIVGDKADELLEYIASGEGFDATLDRIERLSGGPSDASKRMREIRACALETGIADRIALDPAIMRGHDYYTGIVYETYLDAMPEIGQVCGGGRYDDLASLYTKKRMPGVGASVGLDRLLAALEALGRSKRKGSYARAIVMCMEEGLTAKYQNIAGGLRQAGIACDVFPEKKKLPQQYAYAEKKGIAFAVMAGPEDLAKGVYVLKNLATRESFEIDSVAGLAEKIRASEGS